MSDRNTEGYERQDFHLGRVVAAAGASVAGIAAALALTYWVLTLGLAGGGDEGPLPSPAQVPAPAAPARAGAPEGPSTGPSAGPLLQVDPQADLQEFLTSTRGRLQSHGWVNRDQGVAHIPIERAMDLVAERGIPTWAPAATPDAATRAHDARARALRDREPAP